MSLLPPYRDLSPASLRRLAEFATDEFDAWAAQQDRTYRRFPPHCQYFSAVVARVLEKLGLAARVRVVLGRARGSDEARDAEAGSHWWLKLDGRLFDPKERILRRKWNLHYVWRRADDEIAVRTLWKWGIVEDVDAPADAIVAKLGRIR